MFTKNFENKMARYNFKCRTMEDNKPERNYNRNQKMKVELDRAHN